MSTLGAVSTQHSIHFHLTQQIWNQAWHSEDGCSMKSLGAKVACIVFPILLSIAIVEGVIWAARSVFKISSDPNKVPLNPHSVKQILPEVIQEPKQEEEINKVDPQEESSVTAQQTLPEVVQEPKKKAEKVEQQQVKPDSLVDATKTAEQPLPEVVQEPKQEEEINKVEQQQMKPDFLVDGAAIQRLQEVLAKLLQVKPEQRVVKNNCLVGFDARKLFQLAPLTLNLAEGSSQEDIEDNENDPENLRPPACAYHAMQAAASISSSFDFWNEHFELIRTNMVSVYQRNIIKLGTKDYFDAVKKDPTLKEAADLENIKIKDPDSLARLHLHLEQTNQDRKPMDERINAIVEHLFIPQEEPKYIMFRKITQIALLKNGKNEHIAIVCAANKAIIFNSHYNEVTLVTGKEPAKQHLLQILEPYAVMQERVDQKPFSYTLGQYNTTK